MNATIALARRALLSSVALVGTLSLAACPKSSSDSSRSPDEIRVGSSEATQSCPASAPAPALSTQARAEAADALARRAAALFDVPGMSVAVVADGKVVLAQGYGEVERGGGQAIDANTSFAIASNTKAFTATAIGLLVQEGKLNWDDRVVDHLPQLELWDPYLTRELTVRDLLSHRVGLATWAGDLMWLSSNYDRKTIMARLKHLPAAYGFRERYGYCNLMFMVAGELIEQRSGQNWDDFVRARILDPLGMKGVSTRVGQLEGRDNVAKPHIKVDGKWETTPYLDLAAVGPAASLHASASDLARWVQMQLDDGAFEGKQVVPAQVIQETRHPHMWINVPDPDFLDPQRHLLGYALGWYVADYRGRLLVTHGGGMPGMTSRVVFFPEEQTGVVVLTSSESGVSNALALSIADLFLSPPDAPRKDYLAETKNRADAAAASQTSTPIELTGAPPVGLKGKWKNPMLGAAQVETVGDETWFEVPLHGGLRCQLFAAQGTVRSAQAPEAASTKSGETQLLVPCRWTDPNMGVSMFRVEKRGKRVKSFAFRVRPDFYDPLEYTYTR